MVSNSVPLDDMGNDINQKILFSKIWDRVEHLANMKIREGQSTNDMHTSFIGK